VLYEIDVSLRRGLLLTTSNKTSKKEPLFKNRTLFHLKIAQESQIPWARLLGIMTPGRPLFSEDFHIERWYIYVWNPYRSSSRGIEELPGTRERILHYSQRHCFHQRTALSHSPQAHIFQREVTPRAHDGNNENMVTANFPGNFLLMVKPQGPRHPFGAPEGGPQSGRRRPRPTWRARRLAWHFSVAGPAVRRSSR
jgi:hypothetical protein